MHTCTKKFKLSHNEMRQLLKDNSLRGHTLSKPKIAEILISNKIVKHEDIFNEVEQKIETKQERKSYLTKSNTKKIKITDIITGKVKEYPSIYIVRKEFKVNVRRSLTEEGKLYKQRCRIEYA